MNLWLLIVVGASLSMDAFSLSLSLGSFNINKKEIFLLSALVALFHFVMPILGMLLGNSLTTVFNINSNKLLFIIFLFITLEMTLDLFNKDKKVFILSVFNIFLIAFSVSLDSLTIGLGLNNITSFPIVGCVIFSVLSSAFTLCGIIIGKYSYQKIGFGAKLIGVILMLFLAIKHFYK